MTVVDLMKAMGLTRTAQCPHCQILSKTNFDKFKIETAKTIGERVVSLPVDCQWCKKKFLYQFRITGFDIKKVENEEGNKT
jgi:hypothetical protein